MCRPQRPPEPPSERHENAAVRERAERAERERDSLRRENDRLRATLEAARRAGFQPAAPFSKNRPCPRPRRPGRKPGPAYGRAAHRPVPTCIDEPYDAPLGAAAAQIGPRAVATAAVLHKEFGRPIGKVTGVFQQHFGLTITPGGVVQALHRAARQATPTDTALIETVRHSPVVVPDATGWRVGAQLQWVWVATTPSPTVYAIQPGRRLRSGGGPPRPRLCGRPRAGRMGPLSTV